MQADPVYAQKVIAQRRERVLQRKYGMSLADYEAMSARQKGRCKICKKRSKERLCVDHSHATGHVRGLLCRKCNAMLALGDDDPDRLKVGSAYLRASLKATTNRPHRSRHRSKKRT
jgi:hypothetical protein